MKGYPVFLVGLENKRCVVIGGGHEAERKVDGLLECDAQVAVISQHITSQLQEWVDGGQIEWLARNYQPGDLAGAFLVIAENASAAISTQIWEEGQGALVNVMDDVPHCNFIAGSVLRQGPLTIAISTNGSAPALAVRMRQKMQKEFGPEYGAFLELMQELRQPLAEQYPDFQQRKDMWYRLVDSDILDLLRAGDADQVLARVAEIVGADVLNASRTGIPR
jgi:siroheme synthase-like protein